MDDSIFEPKPKLEIALHQLWSNDQIPGFEDFVEEIDAALMAELEADPLGIVLDIYNFFDSKEKPLNPREFLQFWVSLSDEDRTEFILDTTVPLNPEGKGIAAIMRVLGTEEELKKKIFPEGDK